MRFHTRRGLSGAGLVAVTAVAATVAVLGLLALRVRPPSPPAPNRADPAAPPAWTNTPQGAVDRAADEIAVASAAALGRAFRAHAAGSGLPARDPAVVAAAISSLPSTAHGLTVSATPAADFAASGALDVRVGAGRACLHVGDDGTTAATPGPC